MKNNLQTLQHLAESVPWPQSDPCAARDMSLLRVAGADSLSLSGTPPILSRMAQTAESPAGSDAGSLQTANRVNLPFQALFPPWLVVQVPEAIPGLR